MSIASAEKSNGAITFDDVRVGQLIIAVGAAIGLFRFQLPENFVRPPDWLVWPFADWINFVFVFVKDDLGFIT